jgi:hypothetical protein
MTTADDRETVPFADPPTGRIRNYCYISAQCVTIISRNSIAVSVYREIHNTNITIVTELVSVMVMFYTVNPHYNGLKRWGGALCPLSLMSAVIK